jgi:hypothetical protein
MTTPTSRSLTLLAGGFAICRLDSSAPIPEWALRPGEFVAVCRTSTELSIVADERLVVDGVHADRGYRALRVEGPLPLDLVGVMAELSRRLADAGVPIFPVATFDHDYLFVPGARLSGAIAALESAGHRIRSTI